MTAKVIAEIGINHDGNFETAKQLQEQAAWAGCWAVKYQIRTNFHACVPRHLWETTRKWQGEDLPYFEYRRRLEFSNDQLKALYDHAKCLGLEWFASPWDVESVGRLAAIERDYCKVASASVTNHNLLDAIGRHGFKTVILSCGMSTEHEMRRAVEFLQDDPDNPKFIFMACTSVYPCPPALCNLNRVRFAFGGMAERACEVGYSGHETGTLPSLVAAALGASYIERHLTHDQEAEGSDHAASLTAEGIRDLIELLGQVESMMGDGRIRPLPEERPAIEKLRGLEAVHG